MRHFCIILNIFGIYYIEVRCWKVNSASVYDKSTDPQNIQFEDKKFKEKKFKVLNSMFGL